jgi:hypothetical protein
MTHADLATSLVEQATMERTKLFLKLEETGRVLAQLRLEYMEIEQGESSGGSKDIAND